MNFHEAKKSKTFSFFSVLQVGMCFLILYVHGTVLTTCPLGKSTVVFFIASAKRVYVSGNDGK